MVQADGSTRGLYPPPGLIPSLAKTLCKSIDPSSRLLCLPGKRKISKIYLPTSPLASLGGGCLELPSRGGDLLLCKPPVENYFAMGKSVKGKPLGDMYAHSPLVGLKCLVAPTSKNACEEYKRGSHTTILGDVSKLPWGVHATAKMAPPLRDCIR